MNKQDAIEMLKSMLPEKISYAELVGAVSCYGGGEYVYSDPEPYAIETAISALEKQIPKLAEYTELFGKFKCPSCGEMYDAVYDDKTGEPSVWFNHCPECGQYVVTKE